MGELATIIKKTADGQYSIKKENNKYFTYKGDKPLCTPGGNKVVTSYLPLAERILSDLERLGFDFHSPDSILAWHFTMIDNFSSMEHERVETILTQSFLSGPDWTTTVTDAGETWTEKFGTRKKREDQIKQWLHACTHMQMTAACCIGNAYHSLNVAYVLAALMEKYEGEEREKAYKDLADLINNDSFYGPAEDMLLDFKTFDLYYGIHLKEEGPIMESLLQDEGENDELSDIEDLVGEKVSVDILVGRNFAHFTDGVINDTQPKSYSFPDLELDESEDDDDNVDEDDDDGDEENDFESLADYIPDNCWVKRYATEEGEEYGEAYYLVYISIDDDGEIEEIGCLTETVRRMGGGFFIIPGLELEVVSSYEENYCPPDRILEDLEKLISGRYLPADFTFEGVRLPQKMINEGGNGGSTTEYTYALQSAYRLAYMHMSIDTTEDGVIENFDYSTYKSSGSGWGDMVSRPQLYGDRKDEAVDMLLYIVDRYSEEEYRRLFYIE